MNPKEFLSRCEAEGHKACEASAEYMLQYETMADVWASCERVEWMLWLIDRVGGYERELRLFACDCTERALGRSESPDPRSIEVVRVARLYADGLATEDELGVVWLAARSAVDAAVGMAVWPAALLAARSGMAWLTGMASFAEMAAVWAWSATWLSDMDADAAAAESEERKTQLKTIKGLVINPFK